MSCASVGRWARLRHLLTALRAEAEAETDGELVAPAGTRQLPTLVERARAVAES